VADDIKAISKQDARISFNLKNVLGNKETNNNERQKTKRQKLWRASARAAEEKKTA
jgi:hypothetical protein